MRDRANPGIGAERGVGGTMGKGLPPMVILSGPSGAGKSTVVRRLMSVCALPLELSVSATTRPPRPGEVSGRDYHFLSDADFAKLQSEGKLLECKEVFGRGYWYGTLQEPVSTGRAAGKWVLLEIDVQGAMAVLERAPESLTIFIHPGSMEELERRLRTRGTESESAILRRLEVAAAELAMLSRYRYEVINDDVQRAAEEICQILHSHQKAMQC
jgi:guanylate kinase